jgi:hypothetical protein
MFQTVSSKLLVFYWLPGEQEKEGRKKEGRKERKYRQKKEAKEDRKKM